MNTFVMTVTRKGQLTVPADIREALGISDVRNKLIAKFDPKTKSFTVRAGPLWRKYKNLREARSKPGTKPLLDPRAFYNTRPGVK